MNLNMVTMRLVINGKPIVQRVKGGRRLLDFLREDLQLTGAKEGCGEGECGTCTVLLDGISVLACLTPMEKANGRVVTTVEGVGTPESPHPLQKTMMQEGAIQCGMCTPGMIMSGIDLLQRNSEPGHDEIVAAISGNLCRCTGYQKIIKAIEAAAQRKAQ